MFIGIVGCIGVGKTNLTTSLAKRLGYRTFFEPVKENPYLDDFYADPKRYACIMQFFMLTQRFKQHMEIQELHRNDIGVVQDQIIFGDVLYAKLTHQFGFMDDRDFDNYHSHWQTIKPLLQIPDVLIHLDTTVDNAMKRIKERGRPAEKTISREYIQAQSDLFSEWTDSVKDKTQLIRLNWNSFQPVEDVVNSIEKKLEIQLPIPVLAEAA